MNRTGAEVISFIKNAIESFFIIENIKKYRKCPALGPPLDAAVPAIRFTSRPLSGAKKGKKSPPTGNIVTEIPKDLLQRTTNKLVNRDIVNRGANLDQVCQAGPGILSLIISFYFPYPSNVE